MIPRRLEIKAVSAPHRRFHLYLPLWFISGTRVEIEHPHGSFLMSIV